MIYGVWWFKWTKTLSPSRGRKDLRAKQNAE